MLQNLCYDIFLLIDNHFFMKKTFSFLSFLLFSTVIFALNPPEIQQKIDSVERSLVYQHGTIELKDGIGTITVPEGFKYLDAEQATTVLVDYWGNPPEEDMSLGFVLPEKQGVLGYNGYVFNIEYNPIGYVKDDDADKIDYDDLLKTMQEESGDANKERQKAGYEPIHIVGWAAKPYYDKERKILHWAKEIQFGQDSVNTLNYNVRILGRKGVMVLYAIASIPNLPLVQKDIPKVLDIVKFKEGHRYKDFDPSVDEVAAWTLGGLVAGKVLAKVGFFAIVLKFWKIIALGVIAALSAVRQFFTGKTTEETDSDTSNE